MLQDMLWQYVARYVVVLFESPLKDFSNPGTTHQSSLPKIIISQLEKTETHSKCNVHE